MKTALALSLLSRFFALQDQTAAAHDQVKRPSTATKSVETLVQEIVTQITPRSFRDCGESVTRFEQVESATADACAVEAVIAKKPFVVVRREYGVDSQFVEIFIQNERTQTFRISFDTNICGVVNDSVPGCGPTLSLHPCIFKLTGSGSSRKIACEERR